MPKEKTKTVHKTLPKKPQALLTKEEQHKKKFGDISVAEIVFNTGKPVMIAGKEYVLKPLSIEKDIEWRRKIGIIAGRLLKMGKNQDLIARFGTDQIGAIAELLPILLTEFFDDFVDLLLVFTDELKKDAKHIRKNASSVELMDAIEICIEVALPFVLKAVQIGQRIGERTGITMTFPT